MKTIKTINGQMCICTPVQLTKNISELDVKPFTVKVPAVIQAVKDRMKHCMEQLEEMIAKDLIVAQMVVANEDDDEELSVVRYANGSYFSQLSYRAMEKVVDTFEQLETSYVDVHFLETLSILQLNQIKKALASFYGKWNTICSFIEEIEMYKMSQQGK